LLTIVLYDDPLGVLHIGLVDNTHTPKFELYVPEVHGDDIQVFNAVFQIKPDGHVGVIFVEHSGPDGVKTFVPLGQSDAVTDGDADGDANVDEYVGNADVDTDVGNADVDENVGNADAVGNADVDENIGNADVDEDGDADVDEDSNAAVDGDADVICSIILSIFVFIFFIYKKKK
jgi:hypothetical protein